MKIPFFPGVAALACMAMSSAHAVTFYWDNTNVTNSFGTAGAGGATWAQNSTSPTSGTNKAVWTTSSTGSTSGNALQTTTANDIYNFGSGTTALGGGTITVSGSVNMGNTNFNSTSGSIVLSGGTINYGDAKTITVDNTTNTINSVVGGATTSLTKAGAGTLVLGNNANTYTGSTIINAGTLALDASGIIASSSGVTLGGGTFDVSLKSGGYSVNNLSGTGTVVGALTVSTQLAIGTSPGTIDFDSLTLASTSSHLYDLTGGGSAADLANVSGTLTLSGGTLDLTQLGTFTVGDRFTLFAYETGNLTGTFGGLADGDTTSGAGGLWEIDYDDTSGGLNGGTGTRFVTITAVIPEPRAALLGALGLLVLLRRRRA